MVSLKLIRLLLTLYSDVPLEGERPLVTVAFAVV